MNSGIHQALLDEVIHRMYDESLPRIINCLERLDDKQIWWRPNDASNSIGNMILHLCGNVRQWIYSGLGGHEDIRKRQAEFDATGGMSGPELRELLTSTMAMVRPVIADLPEEELLRGRPVQTFEETGVSILVHVAEHFSYHTGQIAWITKMLTAQPLEFYKDILLE